MNGLNEYIQNETYFFMFELHLSPSHSLCCCIMRTVMVKETSQQLLYINNKRFVWMFIMTWKVWIISVMSWINGKKCFVTTLSTTWFMYLCRFQPLWVISCTSNYWCFTSAFLSCWLDSGHWSSTSRPEPGFESSWLVRVLLYVRQWCSRRCWAGLRMHCLKDGLHHVWCQVGSRHRCMIMSTLGMDDGCFLKTKFQLSFFVFFVPNLAGNIGNDFEVSDPEAPWSWICVWCHLIVRYVFPVEFPLICMGWVMISWSKHGVVDLVVRWFVYRAEPIPEHSWRDLEFGP